MKKRIVSLLLTVAMIVSVCCVFASAAPNSRNDHKYWYGYDRYTVDLDVEATALCCKNESGKTLTAYVDKTTDKATIKVDTTGRCSVKVTDSNGKAVSGTGGAYAVDLKEGWNTFKVVVSPDRITYKYSPYWAYKAPVQPRLEKPVEPVQPEKPAQPEDNKAPEIPANPAASPNWKPLYNKPVSTSETYYVKIYCGDTAADCELDVCTHAECHKNNCGKHGCKLHVCYDLGTTGSETHKITAITNEGGGVSSADEKFTDNKVVNSFVVEVIHGSGTKVNIVPQNGYTIDKIMVDGVEVAPTLVYTFSDVTADHTIAVSFVKY